MAIGANTRSLDLATHPQYGSAHFSAHPHFNNRTTAIDLLNTEQSVEDRINLPSTPYSFSGLGAVVRTYYEDYYNKIYVIPPRVDLGTITGNTAVDVLIWNTYRSVVSLASFSLSTSEILLTGIAPGDSIPPIGTIGFTMIASGDGQPTLDAVIGFTFDNTEYKTLEVTGVRARLFDRVHNWRDTLDIEYEFKTEIITSRSGREQRRSLRQTPRRTIEVSVLEKSDQFRKLERDIVAWQKRTFIFPELTEFARTTTEIGPTDTVFDVDEVRYWMQPDRFVVLYGHGQFVQLTISSVVGNTMTVSGPGGAAIPVGSKIMPAITTRAAPKIGQKLHTSDLMSGQVELNVQPGSDAVRDSGDTFPMFKGREVLMHEPNWMNGLDLDFINNLETVDYGIGLITHFSPVKFSSLSMKATYDGMDRMSARKLLDFLHRMRGRANEFLMPTWTNDIVVAQDLQELTAQLRISGVEYAADYGNDETRRHIFIQLNDGSYLFRKVIDIYESFNDGQHFSVLEFDESFASTIPVSDIRRVCWMPVWRLGSDKFTAQWITDEVARFSLPFLTLESLDAE